MFISQLIACLLWKNVCLGAEYSLLSSAHGTFSKIDPILGPKSNLSKFRKIEIEKDTYTSMFIAALFTIDRIWKQPRFPSKDEWMKKPWYIYTMEYYSVTKRNAFESVLMRWTNLEPTIQSEISQRKTKISYTDAYIWTLEI